MKERQLSYWPQESNQGVWSELSEEVESDLSKSVVSLAVADEHKVLFACSGVAIDCDGDATRFMSSASLVKALNDKRKDHDNLKIEVRNEDHVVVGFLGEYDLEDNTATVNVKIFSDLRTVGFNDVFKFQPHSKVLALGRDVSGKLIATGGILNDNPICEDKPMSSTCKISKVCEGGPLFDFVGNFLGMNLSFSSKKTLFLPKFEVFNILVDYESLDEMEFPALDSSKAVRYVLNISNWTPTLAYAIYNEISHFLCHTIAWFCWFRSNLDSGVVPSVAFDICSPLVFKVLPLIIT
ncbi:uncharacterized protein [Miscanthus floridulus]|uniref:uncharacterized protein isoform X3 n=1 Tax=Miscanthus floridulus TaxID=154761 RepID=UPI003459772E